MDRLNPPMEGFIQKSLLVLAALLLPHLPGAAEALLDEGPLLGGLLLRDLAGLLRLVDGCHLVRVLLLQHDVRLLALLVLAAVAALLQGLELEDLELVLALVLAALLLPHLPG